MPIHREPLYTSRRDLVEKYPTYEDRKTFYRLPTRDESIQAKDYTAEYPLIMTSGRLVEYEGGGDETRSNPWLAELQQDMFAEINIVDANNSGIRDGQQIWVESPEGSRIKVMAKVTQEGVAAGVVWLPFHFGGHFQGRDLRDKYPAGSDPYVLGEACNTAFTYGYDSVTAMLAFQTADRTVALNDPNNATMGGVPFAVENAVRRIEPSLPAPHAVVSVSTPAAGSGGSRGQTKLGSSRISRASTLRVFRSTRRTSWALVLAMNSWSPATHRPPG